MKQPSEKATLGTLLFQRDGATGQAAKAEIETQISRLVLKGTRTYADGEGPAIVAELAGGLRDLAKAGKYHDGLNPAEAVNLAAKARKVDDSVVPDAVKARLAKLT